MESIYGNRRTEMEAVMRDMMARVEALRAKIRDESGMDPVEHILCRIKSEASMREKCVRSGLPENEHSALEVLHDAIGLRVVCPFLNDVYTIRDGLAACTDLQIVREKDYIRAAKPNGYRSYHMIVRTDAGFFVELQLRTISMDTWAALEHHMKYKRDLGANTALIAGELKRCADELASTDVSMQEIRNLIFDRTERRDPE